MCSVACQIPVMQTKHYLLCFTEFVEGFFNEDDGRYRKEDSTCGTPAPNSTKNGLVVACFVLSLFVPIEWLSRIIILIKCGSKPPPPKYENA